MVNQPPDGLKRAGARTLGSVPAGDGPRALRRRALSIGGDGTFFKFLRQVSLFRDLSDDEIRLVAEVCAEEDRDAGDVIFVEGSTADRFYIVMEGRVEVWKNYYDPKPDLLAVHGSGRFFGEMALIDELPRSASVVAKQRTRLLYLYRDDFRRLIRERSSIALSVMTGISSMVRKSNEAFVEDLRKRNAQLERAYAQLKKAHSERLRTERLSTLGKFSSLILHDIRNPLSILRGSAEMVLLHARDTATVERNIGRIIDEADRLNRIAGELLDFSRGEISLNVAIVNLKELVDEVVRIIAEPCASRRIEIRADVPWAGPVLIDHDRMLRVLLNLADNSRKAMPNGGTLCFRVERQDRRLLIAVTDSGEGMEAEVQKRLFEPFYTSSREGGTGLGMSIVKSIVDAHNGVLSFSSRKGSGTTFQISLPLGA